MQKLCNLNCTMSKTNIDTVVFALLVLLTHITSSPSCPAKCSSCETDTSGQLIKATCLDVPIQRLPNTLVELHLSDASMMTLPLGRLRNFHLAKKADLHVLSVQRYNIRDIQSASFQGCPSLTLLDLSNNLILDIKTGTFNSLHNLVYLNLNKNEITQISADMFSGLVSLQELNLAQNKVTVISKNTFKSLLNLTKLHLESNLIASIEAEAFVGLNSINSINLENNHLTVIHADVFPNLYNLRSLNLQRNKLQFLDPWSMFGVALEVLNLAQNNFTRLPAPQLLANISSLKMEINLARNKIKEIHNGDLRHVHLKDLYLVANSINLVQPEAFQDSFIQKLDLQQNKLQSLPDQLQQYMNKSTHMLLSNNPWSCDCDIQWLASMLSKDWQSSNSKDRSQDPVCATPPQLVSWPIRLVENDLQVSCNNHASIPVPTRRLPVPPRQDVITPLLQNQTLTPPELGTSTKDANNVAIIVTVVVLVVVALVVTMAIVTILMSRSKVIPEFATSCKNPGVNFKPRFSQWSLHETLQI